ncbi:MAG: hypothetical protein RIQ50_1035 [Bacteroidota bacterium]
MHRYITIGIISYLILVSQTLAQSVMVVNPSNVKRNAEVVSIEWSAIIKKYPLLDPARLTIRDELTGNVLPMQVEYKGGDRPLNLLVQIDLAPNQKKRLLIVPEVSLPIESKTYGRFVPERKDDFAWENDRIAFRMYGKALEKTPKEMAYGIDVWVKRTNRLIIDERYQRGRYHEDVGDGMDYYHVGLTLGAGNCAPMWNDSICYDGTYDRWKILDNGPLRTTFQLEYDPWLVGPDSFTATKIISLDAGSDFNRIEVKYSCATRSSFELAVGIVKRKEGGWIEKNNKMGWMAYWEPEHGKDGTTGIGVVALDKKVTIDERVDQVLLLTKAKSEQSYIYYTGACWDRAGFFTRSEEWFKHLQAFKVKLGHPIHTIID